MKHTAPQKYTVAWFKLAEFVSRGEKERALGLYRLLSHSFEDYALAYQLAGDILLAFNDEEAIEKYKMAADLYKKNARFLEAIALYEQLIVLTDNILEYTPLLVELYRNVGHSAKLAPVFLRYVHYTIKHNHATVLSDFIRLQKQTFGHEEWFIRFIEGARKQYSTYQEYFTV